MDKNKLEKIKLLFYILLPISIITVIGSGSLLAIYKTSGKETSTEYTRCIENVEKRSGLSVKNIPESTVKKLCSNEVSQIAANTAVEGEKVSFGTLTFDNETRIWILSDFIVPAQSYAFSYSDGREWELIHTTLWTLEGDVSNWGNINGQPFQICFDTTSSGCTTPVIVKRYEATL